LRVCTVQIEDKRLVHTHVHIATATTIISYANDIEQRRRSLAPGCQHYLDFPDPSLPLAASIMPMTNLPETRTGIQRFPARVATKFALVSNFGIRPQHYNLN